jgi:hypothetical protein
VHSVEAELLERDRQRQEKKRQKAREAEKLRNNNNIMAATTTTMTTSTPWSTDGMQPSLFDSGLVGIYHAGGSGGASSSSRTSPALSDDGFGSKRSGLESSDEWNLPAASRYAPTSEVVTHPGTASPMNPRDHYNASPRHAMQAMMDYSDRPPPYSHSLLGTFDAAPPASSNGTNGVSSHLAAHAASSGWNSTSPAHKEPRHGGPAANRRQKEEWEMFLNDNMDEVADEGGLQEQQQVVVGRSATTANWLAGAHLNNMRLALTYRDIYAKYDESLSPQRALWCHLPLFAAVSCAPSRFFWSISPLAPAAMTEELVRLALTSPDEARDDYPLTLNVYVCLVVGNSSLPGLKCLSGMDQRLTYVLFSRLSRPAGATHCGNVEMAKQMLERARWTLSEVFDNPDYNVAQALYVLAIHVLYYEVRSLKLYTTSVS